MGSTIWPGIIGLCVMFLVFLICRELMCWYWKQNEIVVLLKDIKGLLQKGEGVEPAVVEAVAKVEEAVQPEPAKTERW